MKRLTCSLMLLVAVMLVLSAGAVQYINRNSVVGNITTINNNFHTKNLFPVPTNLTAHEPIVVKSDEDFGRYNFTGKGTMDDPYIISGLNITTNKNYGIEIVNTSRLFIIQNCYIKATYADIIIYKKNYNNKFVISNCFFDTEAVANGISITATSTYINVNGTIENNYFRNNYKAIEFNLAAGVKVYNNTIFNSWYGIDVERSKDIMIKGNNIILSHMGFYLQFSDNITISDSQFIFNIYEGIQITSGTEISIINTSSNYNKNSGIALYDVNSVFIANSTFIKNSRGISIISGNNTIIENNLIMHNNDGIWLYTLVENTVAFSNTFLNNTEQAYGYGDNNTWYNNKTKTGNYWSDWDGNGEYANNYNVIDKYPMLPPDTDHDGMPDAYELYYHLNINQDDKNSDLDNDNITNIAELQLDTSPDNNDTDWDGLSDSQEINNYNTNPLKLDTDGDGVIDGEEVNVYRTNPLKTDTDNDGMPDGWEIKYHLNPINNDANVDPDNDGLSNIEEYKNKTSPLLKDTDGDGLTDGDEVNKYGTDPTKADTDGDGLTDGDEVNKYGTDPATSDTDGDGLRDGNEVFIHHTDPTKADTDGDGLTDGDEIGRYYTDPLNPDTDGDGYNDGVEVKAGTNPRDPADHPSDQTSETSTNVTNSTSNTQIDTNTNTKKGSMELISTLVTVVAIAIIKLVNNIKKRKQKKMH